MGSLLSLLVFLAIAAGIGLSAYAAVTSLGASKSKPWQGYEKPGSGGRADGADRPDGSDQA